MKDYRLPENRMEHFSKLYELNLRYGIMPGCVYAIFPKLKEHYGWNKEAALWYGFINSLTQHPLTSLLIFKQLPEPTTNLEKFDVWFQENWPRLAFDTDRLKNKRNTVKALQSYVDQLKNYSSQYDMLNRDYDDLWKFSTDNFYSWGRLSAWSGTEFLHIMGIPAVPRDLLFNDFNGSRSHRNGALFLRGDDRLVYDKRIDNSFDGKYENFNDLCATLQKEAEEIIATHSHLQDATQFTYESQCCQFKNAFFRRRFPGVYVSMLVERLTKHKEYWGEDEAYTVITEIMKTLPSWLWEEDRKTIKQKASVFMDTGVPYNADKFLV